MKRLIAILAVLTVAALCAACMPSGAGSYQPSDGPTDGTQAIVPTSLPSQPTQSTQPTVSEPTQPPPTDPVPPEYVEPELDPEAEQAMTSAYLSQYVVGEGYPAEEVAVAIRYYGEYEGTHVAFVDCNAFAYIDSEVYETIGGLEFRYSSDQKLLVYRDGSYLELSKAYDAGWLSDSALAQLLEYYKLVKYYMYLD